MFLFDIICIFNELTLMSAGGNRQPSSTNSNSCGLPRLSKNKATQSLGNYGTPFRYISPDNQWSLEPFFLPLPKRVLSTVMQRNKPEHIRLWVKCHSECKAPAYGFLFWEKYFTWLLLLYILFKKLNETGKKQKHTRK